MCGRYSLSRPVDELADYFQAHLAPGLAESYEPRYNIAPTLPVVGLAATAHRPRVIGFYRWGFGPRQFNTRSEGVSDKTHRMAVLADGFYEWRDGQPLFFRRADGAPLALAGLWAPGLRGPNAAAGLRGPNAAAGLRGPNAAAGLRGPNAAAGLRGPNAAAGLRGPNAAAGLDRSCTMLTAAAGPDLEGIHHRMPVILELESLAAWVGPAHLDRPHVKAILRPSPGGVLVHHPVDPRVGDVRNDGPDLVAPFKPPEPPLRLFG